VAIRVNPKLIDELRKYGAEDVSMCYHCGNCSAVCPHSQEPYVFPRRSLRALQMGLESRMRTSIEPWLCYYCGQCSDQCPRDAEPGETMMSLRRWLISQYDVTGLGRYFYRSWKAELAAVLLVFVCTVAGLVLYGSSVGSIHVYDGPGAFLPSEAIHLFDFLLAGALVVFLGLNAGRMWWLTMIKDRKERAPLSLYVRRIHLLPLHFFSQMRYAKCGDTGPWLVHFCVVFGYVTMLVLIMGFLEAMQAGPEIRWSVHAFGYAASAALLVATLMMVRARLVKSGPQGHHTHTTDWMFLLLLVVLVVTGIVQHAVHRLGYETAANVAYVVHLSIVVTWFSRYPFTKWSHIIYRPLAMYFAEVRREVSGTHARQSAAPVAGPQLQGHAA